jgi:hypothetical protein
MTIKSLGNTLATFKDIFGRTGTRAYRDISQVPFSATGGNVSALAPGNGYKYHTFTSPGTFTVSGLAGTVDILMVAGGGAGGGFGGGGGAGGLIYYPNMPLLIGPYSIVVGAGGTTTSIPGEDSTFGTNPSPQYLVAKGGGRGLSGSLIQDASGGSGGGEGRSTTFGPGTQASQPGNSGTYGFGNPGGTGLYTDGGNTQTGGGGGAGGSGYPYNSSGNESRGGVGKQYPAFTGPLIGVPSLSPLSGYFAGGGGGGREPAPAPATGGLGGGGNGGPSAPGQSAVTNSGGGGGGGGSIPGAGYAGGAGGSGIVIIRYLA